jgi:DNA-binding transcriptional ArsR family regulator
VPTQTESPAPTGLPTIKPTNGSLPASPGKSDAPASFTKLPNAVWMNSALLAGDRLLYAALAHHQGSNAEAWPSQKLLAAELDVSVSTVRRGLRRLEAAELVKTRQVGLRRTNRYTVLNPGSVTTDDAQPGCAAKPVNMPDRSRVTVPKGRRTSKPLPPTPLLTKSRSRQSSSLLPSPSISIEISEEARRVESQISHDVDINVQKGEEQQLAASESSFEYEELELSLLGSSLGGYALTNSPPREDLSSLVGVEPPRLVARPSGLVINDTNGESMAEVEGVVRQVRQDVQTSRYRLVFEDGREFALPIDRAGQGRDRKAAYAAMSLISSRVRFPVREGGEIAARPRPVNVGTVVDGAAPAKAPEVEVPGQSPADDDDDRMPWERDEAQSPERPPPAEAERPPWERIGKRVDEIAEAQERDARDADARHEETMAALLASQGSDEWGPQILVEAEEGRQE